MRTQEVLDKAVTGALILMLKWLKVSRKQHGPAPWVHNANPFRQRCTEVRVHHPAAGRLELCSLDLEAVAIARH